METESNNKLVPFDAQAEILPKVEPMILTIRGRHVMLDRDLTTLYGIETKVLN